MAYKILHVATSFECEALLSAIDESKQSLVDILIDNEFKDCVAHSNVQSFFSEIWNGKFKRNFFSCFVLFIFIFIFQRSFEV